MLTSIGITGFKSYRDASLKLAPLTVLIGVGYYVVQQALRR